MCIVVGFKDAIYATKKSIRHIKYISIYLILKELNQKKEYNLKKQCSLYIIILIISLEMKNSAW